jgi:2-polyprenyl-6-methoxyphenol hydroxylase-like FAD-dependent oxidoreductase
MWKRLPVDSVWKRNTEGLDEAEYIARAPQKFSEFLIGHPTSEQYEITRIRAYKIHQRLMHSMRKWRFVLAGDAAHLCCP